LIGRIQQTERDLHVKEEELLARRETHELEIERLKELAEAELEEIDVDLMEA
jgi:hypothetical protein